jgi:para-aminobenzoate synthetase component 1
LRQKTTFPLAENQHTEIKRLMLDWANQFSIILFLDSNNYQQAYGKYECLLAVDALETINGSLTELQQVHDTHNDWLFGHITYDHKNELESKLSSTHNEVLGFPSLQFFTPRVVFYITYDKTALVIESVDVSPESIYNEILSAAATNEPLPQVSFQKKTDKQHYLDTIATLRKHIEEGDCYEINYCTEGYAEDVTISPLSAFRKLNDISPAPFAAYYRLEDKYMMCASPERYLQKTGDTLISQPIKGTARRATILEEDKQIKNELQQSVKERAENVMIVDLTRNDLSRVCEVGSINVEELFGIYTYPQVHQMISTVSGVMKNTIPLTDAIRYSFPMGSMTGAPKIKVMQLIDKYEQSRRELFSGTVGYITPTGDFDFNVIIRSLFYNAQTRYLTYQTGGAITYDSIAEMEWEEMRLKAGALEQVFSKDS